MKLEKKRGRVNIVKYKLVNNCFVVISISYLLQCWPPCIVISHASFGWMPKSCNFLARSLSRRNSSHTLRLVMNSFTTRSKTVIESTKTGLGSLVEMTFNTKANYLNRIRQSGGVSHLWKCLRDVLQDFRNY